MKKSNLPNKYKCIGCMTCGDICPKHCIKFELMEDGHFMPKIDYNLCIQCHKCEKVCPVLNKNKGLSTKSSPFASWTNDDILIKKSSSGGTFAQIAKDFILSGGFVAGAYIDSLDVKHILIDNIDDLHLLQGSKYIQSRTCGIYNEVLNKLKEGKKILFSGTPCQIAGLYNIIPKKLWENLFSIDLICHGVPSRKDLFLYLDSHNPKISKIQSFRDKTWKYGYAMTLIDENGCKVQDENNYFFDSFNANKTLRWSCYNCPFKTGLQRQSDITIGDFWGAKKYEDQKNKGLSLCIIHTLKGQILLENNNLHYESIDWEECLPRNKDYFNPSNFFKYHPLRKLYPKIVKSCDFETLKILYGKPESKVSLKYRPLLFINSIIQYIDSKYKHKVVNKMLCKIKKSES
ncbi:MAG: Coenzyme F420 hydrogenase/dehydrogenase, beta subunit C-terminal domain [Muribaculaceae bacterium]|nr:Coenzyme F420 hydrogenase/dehydrogenase, beta subunit C-terminal domain [Muribaculaceae bacterium]